MRDGRPDSRSLPEWIETCYEVLEPHILNTEEDFSPDEAEELLLQELGEEIALEPEDTEYAIQRLLDRGYLYEVGGSLFVTEPDSDSE